MLAISTISWKRSTGALVVLAVFGLGVEYGRLDHRHSLLAEGAQDPAPEGSEKKNAAGGKKEEDVLRLVPKSSREAKPIIVPEGRILLLDFLQSVADNNAQTVYVVGSPDRKRSIRLTKTHTKLPFTTAEAILRENGFYLSRQQIGSSVTGKKNVLWVQPKIERVKRRGALIRRGEGERPPRDDRDRERRRDREDRSDSREPADLGTDLGTSRLKSRRGEIRIFRRDDGGGRSWLVQYETTDRDEADDIASLIRANLEAASRR